MLTLLLIPCMTSINAQDNPYDTWKTTALKSPSKGQLVAAGDIKISWNSLEKVQHYDIYFDGKYEKSVEANITQTTIYSTAVARHTIRVVAVLENNDEENKIATDNNKEETENKNSVNNKENVTKETKHKNRRPYIILIFGICCGIAGKFGFDVYKYKKKRVTNKDEQN